MKLIDKVILWYLQKTHKCIMQHGKYGWEITSSFHTNGQNVKIEKYTYELFKNT